MLNTLCGMFLLLISSQLLAEEYDSPALDLTVNEQNKIELFSDCIRGESSLGYLWDELRTGVLINLNLSSRYTPRQVVTSWFESFKSNRYKGMFHLLFRNANAEEIENAAVIRKARRYAEEVENAYFHYDTAIQFIDLGARNNARCAKYRDFSFRLVDEQRDFAMEWVSSIRFLARHFEGINDTRKKRRKVQGAYNKLQRIRHEIRSMQD